MKELSVGEQRYKAVMAVVSGGRTVTEEAPDWKVSRQTMHAWLARYEREGMEGMGDRSHRPTRCPHQMPALIEVRVLEMRRHARISAPSIIPWARCRRPRRTKAFIDPYLTN
jgi:transposase-like protein